MHLIYPTKFCITIVLDFPWDDSNTQENWIQWLDKILEVNQVCYCLSKSGTYEKSKLDFFSI